MQTRLRVGSVASAWLVWMLVACPCFGARGQPAESPAPASMTAATNLTEELSRLIAAQVQALTELQAQQIATLKELELTREDIAATIAESASNNAANLAAVSELMARQRQQDLKMVRDAHRLGLAIVVGLSGLLLLSIIVLNLTSIRALNRMTGMFSASALLPDSQAQALADERETSRQLLLFPGEVGQRQLGVALLQIHSRIEDLEKLAGRFRQATSGAGDSKPVASDHPAAKAPATPA